jgi:hypothetical protein
MNASEIIAHIPGQCRTPQLIAAIQRAIPSGAPILTPEVLSAHRLPIPVSIMADICNTAPKEARCEQRGDWFVILQPA